MPLSAGDKLRNYGILGTVGQGGMGAVYQAISNDGQQYAIKEMVIDIRDPYERKRAVGLFASEADLLRQLDHPKLVKSHDFFSVDDHHYMVMDFIDGQTLAERLDSRQEIPALDEVLGWADQICEALVYLHSRVPIVIFRDLKPSNIMLDKQGGIHLIDFGIARVFEDESRTNTFIKGVGSKGFAPIEQYGAGGTDVRTDVYSLGATLYNLLTGEKPPASIGMLAGTDALEPLRTYNPDIPRALERIVLVSMALRKENRYGSIEEVRGLLRKVAQPGEDNDQLTGALAEDDFDLEAVLEATRPTGQLGSLPALPAPKINRFRFLLVAVLAIVVLVSVQVAIGSQPSEAGNDGGASAGLKNEWVSLGAEEQWHYLDDGKDMKTAWRELDFDDSKWPTGMPRFGYGDPVVTELKFGPNPEKKYMTAYFRKTFEIDNLAQLKGQKLRLRLLRDDGAVIYLNGKEAFRANMPKGEITFGTPAATLVAGQDEKAWVIANIDVNLLRDGKNVLAAEVHQNEPMSSDLGFSASLETMVDNK